mmetsp:Transcript_71963/g.187617  ORF Transcript_71963/g.187617 Transcript_71963/m.187617 type:complete len:203 (-) Transcript_71963:1967-2575(-)
MNAETLALLKCVRTAGMCLRLFRDGREHREHNVDQPQGHHGGSRGPLHTVWSAELATIPASPNHEDADGGHGRDGEDHDAAAERSRRHDEAGWISLPDVHVWVVQPADLGARHDPRVRRIVEVHPFQLPVEGADHPGEPEPQKNVDRVAARNIADAGVGRRVLDGRRPGGEGVRERRPQRHDRHGRDGLGALGGQHGQQGAA